MTSKTELIQELKDLHETTLERPLPYPADVFAEELERAIRELDPLRKVRDVFQAALEEARSAKVALDDLGFLRRIVLRERVELRRLVRAVLGVSEQGTAQVGGSDDQLIDGWKTQLVAEEGRAPSTVETYLSALSLFRRFVEPRGLRLKQVDRDDVIAYKETLIRGGICAATVNARMGALRSFYDYLTFTGDVERSPLRFIRRLKAEQRRLPVLTVKEMEALVSAIDAETVSGLRDLALVVLFCATGARLSEVLNVRLEDVDFARGLVTYRGRKNKDDASIVLTPNAQAVLKRYLEKARPRLLKKVKNPEWRDLLVLSSRGRPLHRGSVSNLLAAYARKAGLTKHVSAHTFRRSIATTLANNGMPAEILKVFLGHRSINTTLNHYVVYADEAQRRAVEDYHRSRSGRSCRSRSPCRPPAAPSPASPPRR